MSNVDLSMEFTEMITTQRGFQANSRIITTSDEMLQELVNLKRQYIQLGRSSTQLNKKGGDFMIKVKRLNEKEFVINSDLIEFIEETPDTVITLTTGRKVVVKESVDDIIEKVIDFKTKTMKYIK